MGEGQGPGPCAGIMCPFGGGRQACEFNMKVMTVGMLSADEGHEGYCGSTEGDLSVQFRNQEESMLVLRRLGERTKKRQQKKRRFFLPIAMRWLA